MRRLYFAFLRGLSANRYSQAGVFLTTSAFILFVLFQLGSLVGLFTNAYLGLIAYLGLPALFMVGLLLIPFGWWRHSKSTGRPFRDLFAAQFSEEDIAARQEGAPLIRVILLLTLINVVFVGVIGSSTVHFMDSAHFCGTACHSVMGPEWATYQASPHANVKCVECHVGEGTVALFKSKLNGAWQMISATFDLYERPIPTPVGNLRPARETCEKCHWPEKFHGNSVVNRVSFDMDEENTPMYTTLLMKIGTGSEGQASGSHWHVADMNEVRYSSLGDEREEMMWVEAKQADGTWKRYENSNIIQSNVTGGEHIRSMDCVDCHNRATHIYEQPETALDLRMARGEIDRSLPFIKQKALGVLLGSYADKEAGLRGIEVSLWNWYRENYPDVLPAKAMALDAAITSIQQIYDRNIHPGMNVDWGSYNSYLGHQEGDGCFRCHNPKMVDEEGLAIRMDCTLCHSILADKSPQPFQYLQDPTVAHAGVDSTTHQYLHDEFWNTVLK